MSWDDEAATWDTNPAVQTYAKAAYQAVVDHLAAQGTSLDGMRVLDFGCGTGLLTVAMAEAAETVVGLDLSEGMVAVLAAKGVPNVQALAGTLAQHDLAPVQLVTASSVCAFVDDYPGTVRALVDRLAPGGWFVQLDWELDPTDEEPYGLSRDDIRAALEGAGLFAIDVRTGFQAPYEGQTMAPLMGVGRKPQG